METELDNYVYMYKYNVQSFNHNQLTLCPFTVGARALHNILRSECFSFALALAYVVRCLAFVACVVMVASSLLVCTRKSVTRI